MSRAYERIAGDLRSRVRAGRVGPGDRLPSERALAEEYGRSVSTVRQALAQLTAEGLLERVRGRGTFVRTPRRRVVRSNDRHQWAKDRARQGAEERARTGSTEYETGLGKDRLVFDATYEQIAADADLAGAGGLAEGTPLLKRTYRTRYVAEPYPFNIARSYIPRELLAGNPQLLDEASEPYPGGTTAQLDSVGIEIDRMVEHVTARPPTYEEAGELGLPPGTSLLAVRRLSIDTEDRVVDIADTLLPGDRTELVFTTRLTRWEAR